MKIVDGVHLHLIKTEKFKTNRITFRFTGEHLKGSVARRVLVAQMLATANQDYPNHQALQRALANLYGAKLSTRVSRKGRTHLVDITIDFIKSRYSFGQEELLGPIMDLLYTILYKPLTTLEQFHSQTFDIEKENLLAYLEADKEDSFYYSELGLNQLYFQDENLQVSKYGQPDLVAKENSFTAYQEFQRMLKEDQIDIFLLGDLDGYSVMEKLNDFPLTKRKLYKYVNYKQEVSNITKEAVTRRADNQTVLQLAYQLPVNYGDITYPHVQVLNGMLGAFAHSRLFTEVREKSGLAYSIGSQIDGYTALLKIHAGIDRENREKTISLINQQWHDFKLGRFSIQLLNQTKDLLVMNAKLAQDNPDVMIEQVYNNKFVLKDDISLDSWIKGIQSVSKKDIVTLAKKIHLQAVYSLEGGQ